MSYLTEPLDHKHDRGNFSCGKDLLDSYFRDQVTQDIKRKLSTCFVLYDQESKNIAGYYTLSSNCIPNNLIPDSFRRRLPPSYTSIPTILLGRLAVDFNFQGRGKGGLLLLDALKRSFDTSDYIGAFAVVVDPFDEEAERFYEKYGFIKLPDSRKMFLPMKTIKKLFG